MLTADAIVARGTWTYDGVLPRPVDIVGLGYDFWYELGAEDGDLDPREKPRAPGPTGLLYYVRFRHAGGPLRPTWPDSPGALTVEDAKRAAEKAAPSTVVWDAAPASTRAGPARG